MPGVIADIEPDTACPAHGPIDRQTLTPCCTSAVHLHAFFCFLFSLSHQEDILVQNSMGKSATFDLTAGGVPDAEVRDGASPFCAFAIAAHIPRCLSAIGMHPAASCPVQWLPPLIIACGSAHYTVCCRGGGLIPGVRPVL